MLSKLFILFLLLPAAVFGQQWKLIAPMNVASVGCATILLNDGRILAAAGYNNGIVEDNSETYDPSSDRWTNTGKVNIQRDRFSFTKLLDGRVFVAGGYVDNTATTLSSTEVFDPIANTWSISTPLNEITEGSIATLLLDGRVLVTTGVIGGTWNYKTACEIFDPKTNSMSYTGSVSIGQADNNLFTIPSTGHVILLGGHYNGVNGTWLDETEEYDPLLGTWSVVAHSQTPHSYNTALLLPDERIIAAAGSIAPPGGSLIGNQASSVIEIYDHSTKKWLTIGNLPIPIYGHSLAYIGRDSVLIGGGLDPVTGKSISDCEIVNLRTGVVSKGPQFNVARNYFQFIVQKINPDPCSEIYRVYAIGGIGGFKGAVDQLDSSLSSCEMIEFRHGTPNTLSLPKPMSLNGTVCAGIDTSVSIAVSGCSEFHIDSVIVEGLTNSSLNTKLPDTLKNGANKTFQLSLHSTITGLNQGSVRIFYNTGGIELDTIIPITMNLKPSTRGTIKSIIHDIIDGGDTVLVPVYLASNSGDRAQGFQVTAHYNTDLLTPIAPEFTGTLTANAVVWDQNQIAGGITMYADQPFSISTSKPLVILKFETAVTKSECTSFVIDNLQISFDSTGNNADPCPLAVTGDSATICRANACGDITLRGFMTNGSIPGLSASYDRESDRIIISEEKDRHDIQILNMLGQVIERMNISGEKNYINVSALQSGIYIIRSSDGINTRSQKISVMK